MEKNSAVEALFKRTTAGIKPGLDVISALLEVLGNPHHKLAVVHVAGTNGKGSVCAMLESVLRASGFKTGLYTSPHLIDFSERFRINGVQIPEQRLLEYIALMEERADDVEQGTGLRAATFFEISTAIAFQYFADEAVDVAIIETGMGGRWDATNVVIPLVSVITRIDIDHTNFLGDTIEAIAAEKAGIIKPGRPVVSAPQSDAVMAVLQKTGQPIICSGEAVSVVNVDGASRSVGSGKQTLDAPLQSSKSIVHRAGSNEAGSFVYAKPTQKLKIETHSQNLPPINLPLLGECQRENCAVAVVALEVLADMLDIEPDYKAGLESVEWGARFQTLESDPLIILDGAHNPSAGKALADTLKELYPKHQVGFIFGFLDDKESVEFMKQLMPRASRAWTIPVEGPRGTTAAASAAQAQVAGIEADPVSVAEALASARTWAAGEDRLICITGSLMLKQMLTDL